MNKKNVLSKLKLTRKKLVTLLKSVPISRWNEVFLGKWSLSDLTAHLIGWDYENSRSINEILSGKIPSCFSQWDDNWVSYNDILVAKFKHGRKEELLSELEKAHRRYLKVLESIPEGTFNKDIGLRWHEYKLTPAVNVSYETQDEECHTKQIEDWLQK